MERNLDPTELMKLIQKVCLYGGDHAYIPDNFITVLKELITRKQGSQTPAEYDEQVGSNLKVFCDFVKLPPGTPLFSMFPVLQEHVIVRHLMTILLIMLTWPHSHRWYKSLLWDALLRTTHQIC